MSVQENEFSSQSVLQFDFARFDGKTNSEIPLKLQHQIANVLSVVKAAIEKLKISLILPKIFENPRVLHLYLKGTKYENVIEKVLEYRNKMKSKTLPEGNHDDYDLLQLIDYFQENYKIVELLPAWLDDIDNREKYLLTAMENIYEIAQIRFHRSAKLDLAKEKRLHDIYLANEEVQQQIKQLKHKLETKEIKSRWKETAKSATVKNLEDQLAFIQYDNDIAVKRERFASQREFQRISHSNMAQQQELKEFLEKERLCYETQVQTNVIKEQKIRDERNKLQLQLLALIKKYDETILEKHKEEMLLQEEHDQQQQKFNEFLKEYEIEEALYQEVVVKRQKLHEAKILLFSYARAAKKIQKWWKLMKRNKTKAAREKSKRKDVKGKKDTVVGDNKKYVKKSKSKGKKK